MATSPDSSALIDPRGPRFGAAITTLVLAAALIIGPDWGWILLGLQAVVFGLGSLVGLAHQPYGRVFRRFVRPRLGAPVQLEDERPPRFAQSVGLGFALVGLLGVALGAPVVFYVATGLALVAALLNAAFDFCLGCELYLLGQRLRHRVSPAGSAG